MSTPKKKINKNHIRTAAAILSAFTFAWVAFDLLRGRGSAIFRFEILHRFGHSAIVMMLLSSLTVVAKNYKVPEGWFPHKVFGFYALLYAISHAFTFWLINNFAFLSVLRSVQFPIVLGNLALIILLAMEVTSTKKWRAKHNKTWRTIHYLYNAAVAAVVLHVALVSKIAKPILYFYAAFFIVFIVLHIKPVRTLLLKKK